METPVQDGIWPGQVNIGFARGLHWPPRQLVIVSKLMKHFVKLGNISLRQGLEATGA